MPLLPVGTVTLLQPESWPPTCERYPPSLDGDITTDDEDWDADLPRTQKDPLRYFITPPASHGEEFEFDFEFDAGIEDANHPAEIIRNVSPSTLDGLRKYKAKGDCAILDSDSEDEDEDGLAYNNDDNDGREEEAEEAEEEEEEQFIHLDPGSFEGFTYGGMSPGRDTGSPVKSSSPVLSKSAQALLSPNSFRNFHVGSPLVTPKSRFPRRRQHPLLLRGRPRHVDTLQRRHSWREPSPDVWSIEEEPEIETMSEVGTSFKESIMHIEDNEGTTMRSQPIDIPDAKPRKKVRFALPSKVRQA